MSNAILTHYPFAVRDYGDGHYGNPVAVARIATGIDESTIHIFGDHVVKYEVGDKYRQLIYTDDMLITIKREVRELYAALGWPAPAHDMMAGADWTWLVIKHARGLLS